MRFPIDNALSPVIAEGLKQDGHDAVHVRERGMQAAEDVELFLLAAQEDRILESADTDFAMLLALRATTSPSVILFRTSTRRTPGDRLAMLRANLRNLDEPLQKGCIVVIEDSRVRIRSLPINPPSP